MDGGDDSSIVGRYSRIGRKYSRINENTPV